MAAAVYFQNSGRDAQLSNRRVYLTAAATEDVAKTALGAASGALIAGKLTGFSVSAVGTTMTVDVYDANDADSTINPMWRYATAEGKQNQTFNRPFTRGLKVVVGGTPGEVTLDFEV